MPYRLNTRVPNAKKSSSIVHGITVRRTQEEI